MFDGSQFSGGVHSTQSSIAVSDKTLHLLLHVLKEVGVQCA
jgi:hypothetical protein